MVEDWIAKTMYATRRRKRNVRKSAAGVSSPAVKVSQAPLALTSAVGIRGVGANGELIVPTTLTQGVRSNPSKRHRERLNIELECLAELLPFDGNIVSKLDKLSILRLASSYLKAKCYLKNCAESCPDLPEPLPYLYTVEDPFQSLDGFLLIVTTDGELFFSSSNVETYLGFHQSDILHQSVLELIHSEDREMFKEQLEISHRNLKQAAMSTPRRSSFGANDENAFLQRSFTARFRCLLDNTSGFVTMDVTGRLQPFPPGFPNSLTGGNNLAAASAGIRTRPSPTSNSSSSSTTADKSSTPSTAPTQPSLALFAFCQPFGPGAFPVAAGQIDIAKTFKSKHALDMSFVSVDPRVRQVIDGADERDFLHVPFYSIVHVADIHYVSTAHAELMKRGSCGILAYRVVYNGHGKSSNSDESTGSLVWLQTSARIIYRCNKADTILCIHRRLTDDEGEGLLMKRASEFRLPCALFDAVDAAATTSQNKQAGGDVSVSAGVNIDINQAESNRVPSSGGAGLGEGPPGKKAKTTGKRQTKKTALKASVDQSSSISTMPAPQSAAVEVAWPLVSTPCGGYNSSYPTPCYSATSIAAAEQFSGQNAPFSQQQLPNYGYLSAAELSYYYQQQNNTLTPSATWYDDVALQQQQQYMYGANLGSLAGPGWNSRTGVVSEKLLSSCGGYRMVFEEDNRGGISPSTGNASDESPPQLSSTSQLSADGGFASVIRHTTGFQHQNQLSHQLQSPPSGYVANYDNRSHDYSGTPVTTTSVGATLLPSNHPAMFQAQPVYAATPAPQFIS